MPKGPARPQRLPRAQNIINSVLYANLEGEARRLSGTWRLLRHKTAQHAPIPGSSMTKLDGSGTVAASFVIVKFSAEKLGIASRPGWPFRFNILARIFRSALLLLRSVEYTSRAR